MTRNVKMHVQVSIVAVNRFKHYLTRLRSNNTLNESGQGSLRHIDSPTCTAALSSASSVILFDSYLIPIDTLYTSLILLKDLHSNGSLTHIIMFHSASTSLAVEVPSLSELSFTGLVKVCFIMYMNAVNYKILFSVKVH